MSREDILENLPAICFIVGIVSAIATTVLLWLRGLL